MLRFLVQFSFSISFHHKETSKQTVSFTFVRYNRDQLSFVHVHHPNNDIQKIKIIAYYIRKYSNPFIINSWLFETLLQTDIFDAVTVKDQKLHESRFFIRYPKMYEFKFVRTEPEMFKVLSPDFNCIENKNPGDSSVL